MKWNGNGLMTVGQLIEELKEYDMNSTVVLETKIIDYTVTEDSKYRNSKSCVNVNDLYFIDNKNIDWLFKPLLHICGQGLIGP